MSTDTPAAVQLRIPPAAADEWFTCGCSEDCGRAGYQHPALPIVVAAELRRLAAAIDSDASHQAIGSAVGHSPEKTAARLRARADELDPQ